MKKTGFGITGFAAVVAAVAVAAAALFLCAGCNDGGVEKGDGNAVAFLERFSSASGVGTFKDGRDGKTYKKVKIGNQTWMAENLNYADSTSWCYDNSEDSCAKYGRLYDWETAKTACPAGWKLPNQKDWAELVGVASGPTSAGMFLKAKSGWRNNGNGDDDFGFMALPGGLREWTDGKFKFVGEYGYWWTATAMDDTHAYSRDMSYNIDQVGEGGNYGGIWFSVRCIKGN